VIESTCVPSGDRIATTTMFSTSASDHSSLWATTVRPGDANASEVHRSAAAPGAAGHASSSPQFRTASADRGTPAPSAIPASSSTYRGSARSPAAMSAAARRSPSANVIPAHHSKCSSRDACRTRGSA
jgi:hypothetical protein